MELWLSFAALAILLFLAASGAVTFVEWAAARWEDRREARERRRRNQAHPWRRNHY
jgi:hypothetical protein